MLLKQMADEDFTPKTGIGIRLNILPAGQLGAGSVNAMLLAISSGRAPDVGLATSTNSIGEFALRNAVVDLSGLEGFAEVRERFLPELFIPMTYQDGIYGLPETMKFTALLYRKDILSELGLSLPETWEDLYDKIIPVLYQNNMQFYIPAAEGLLGRGVAGLLEAAGRDEVILLPRRQPGPRHGSADTGLLGGGQPFAQIANAPMAQPLQVADGLQQPSL